MDIIMNLDMRGIYLHMNFKRGRTNETGNN